jgi:hypothetical protein
MLIKALDVGGLLSGRGEPFSCSLLQARFLAKFPFNYRKLRTKPGVRLPRSPRERYHPQTSFCPLLCLVSNHHVLFACLLISPLYYRKTIRGLSNRVCRLERNDIRSPNLKIHIEWIEKKNESVRFCLGPIQTRESLLIFRDR